MSRYPNWDQIDTLKSVSGKGRACIPEGPKMFGSTFDNMFEKQEKKEKSVAEAHNIFDWVFVLPFFTALSLLYFCYCFSNVL